MRLVATSSEGHGGNEKRISPRGRLRLHWSGGVYWTSIHLCQCRAGLGTDAVPSDPALVPEGRRGGAGLIAEGARSILQQKMTLEGGTENGTCSSAHTLPTVPVLGICISLGNFQVAINNLLLCISQTSNRDASLWHFPPVTSSVLCSIVRHHHSPSPTLRCQYMMHLCTFRFNLNFIHAYQLSSSIPQSISAPQ